MRAKFSLLILSACSFDKSGAALDDDSGVETADASTDAGRSAPYGFSPIFKVHKVPESTTVEGFSRMESSEDIAYWFSEDVNADGFIDIIQTLDPATNQVWRNGAQPYWAVFLGNVDGFDAEAISWLVPTTLEAKGYFRREGNLSSERWAYRDIDGDECADFIRLIDPSTGAVWNAGNDVGWDVHLCEPGGFSNTPIRWVVPTPTFARTDECTSASGCWALVDISGDGLLDLVQTSDVGLQQFDSNLPPYWRVYEGGQAGFAGTFQTWQVPTNESSFGFYSTQSFNAGRFWRVIDIDVNGKLDLVQTSPYITTATESDVFSDAGQPSWKVYSAESGGYLNSTVWPVPISNHAGGFYSISRSEDVHHWSTLDIDGDGYLDLVHTADSEMRTASVWGSPLSDQWKVYRGEDSGFGDLVVWPVPDSNTVTGFYSTRSSQGTEQWQLVDIDGDGQIELVQTANPSTGEVWRDELDAPYWRVFVRN